MKGFGVILRLIRVFYGLRQVDLAEALSVSQSAICEYETGRKDVPLTIVERVKDEFDVHVKDFGFLAP
jgi:predicted transcriptional regulator